MFFFFLDPFLRRNFLIWRRKWSQYWYNMEHYGFHVGKIYLGCQKMALVARPIIFLFTLWRSSNSGWCARGQKQKPNFPPPLKYASVDVNSQRILKYLWSNMEIVPEAFPQISIIGWKQISLLNTIRLVFSEMGWCCQNLKNEKCLVAKSTNILFSKSYLY